jgi:PAS domain S-box-containing protein
VTAAAFLGMWRVEQRRAESAFHALAAQPIGDVQRNLDLYLGDLQSISHLYAASQAVERDEFRAFVVGMLARREAIEALAWAPRVSRAERPALEAAASAGGMPELRIREWSETGQLVPASPREGYLPAWYVEPITGHRELLGQDLAADLQASGALTEAGGTGRTVAFRGEGLVEGGAASAILGAVVPVYAHDTPSMADEQTLMAALQGYVVGLYGLGDLLKEALGGAPTGVVVHVYDAPDPTGRRPIASYPPLVPGAVVLGGMQATAGLDLQGLDWSVVCVPGSRLAGWVQAERAWWVLALGVLFTLAVTAYLMAVAGRAAYAEALVDERTADLSRTNRDLQAEMATRERAEAALRESEERYRSLVERMSEGLSVLNEEGCFTYVNGALARMLGYTREELLGRPAAECVDEASRAILQDQLERRRRGEDQPYELAYRHRSGRPVHTIVSPRPLLDSQGRYCGTFAVVTDISRRKLAEEQLERTTAELRRSNTELEQFAYVASHDLQEPLRKIVAFGDRLASRAAASLDDQARDYLQRMQGAARRMQTLIEDLLAYSRVTTKGQPFVPVDLGGVVEGVLSDLEFRLQETGGRVIVEPLPTLEADPSQMRQLLQNLIGNALKFRRPGVPPLVRISAEMRTDAAARPVCRLTVEDNGIGFPNEYRERIFGLFQRLHARNEYEGTGLGLAICRRVAERHGGTVEAQGVPDEGARLVVTLPVVQAPTA